jgi:hypothetical protein
LPFCTRSTPRCWPGSKKNRWARSPASWACPSTTRTRTTSSSRADRDHRARPRNHRSAPGQVLPGQGPIYAGQLHARADLRHRFICLLLRARSSPSLRRLPAALTGLSRAVEGSSARVRGALPRREAPRDLLIVRHRRRATTLPAVRPPTAGDGRENVFQICRADRSRRGQLNIP